MSDAVFFMLYPVIGFIAAVCVFKFVNIGDDTLAAAMAAMFLWPVAVLAFALYGVLLLARALAKMLP